MHPKTKEALPAGSTVITAILLVCVFSFSLPVHGPHGRAVIHFQRGQCILPYVCCAGVPGHLLQSRHKMS